MYFIAESKLSPRAESLQRKMEDVALSRLRFNGKSHRRKLALGSSVKLGMPFDTKDTTWATRSMIKV